MFDFITDSPVWLLYLGVLVGPFVQEDAAVIAAASLSVTNMGNTTILFIVICVGLFFSDIWKYWIGWAALKNKKGQAFAEKEHITNLQDKVLRHTFVTMVTGRFIPLTRIPIYMACGFFGVSYIKFCFFIAITAVMYVSVIFGVFHLLGAVLGEQVLWVIPLIAFTLLALFFGYHWLKKKKSKMSKSE